MNMYQSFPKIVVIDVLSLKLSQLRSDWSKWMSYKNDEYVPEHPKN